MNRRKYSSQYKEKAIALSEEKEKYAHNSFLGYGKPKMTDQEREIVLLRKELKDTQLETEILKKAISIFSKSRQNDETYGVKGSETTKVQGYNRLKA